MFGCYGNSVYALTRRHHKPSLNTAMGTVSVGGGGGWRRGMRLGFCAGDPGSIPGMASGQASQSPHMGQLVVPLEQCESSSTLVLTDMVFNPQPTNQLFQLGTVAQPEL